MPSGEPPGIMSAMLFPLSRICSSFVIFLPCMHCNENNMHQNEATFGCMARSCLTSGVMSISVTSSSTIFT